MPLLLASDFCRRPSSPTLVRLALLPLDAEHCWSFRTELQQRQKEQREPECGSTDDNDTSSCVVVEESLVIFASVLLLKNACWLTESAVWIEREESDSAIHNSSSHHQHQHHRRRSILRTAAKVRVAPHWLPEAPLEDEDHKSRELPPVVYLSPQVAANLRLWRNGITPDKESVWGHVSRPELSGVAIVPPPAADHVQLRTWGRPIDPFRWTRPSSSEDSAEQELPIPLAASASAATTTAAAAHTHWPLPPAGCLLPVGSVITVAGDKGELYHYEILRVTDLSSSINEASKRLAISTPSTRFDLEQAPREAPCPVLPSFAESQRFLGTTSSVVSDVPHPDVPTLIQQFRSTSLLSESSSVPLWQPAMAIFAVVGTDDNHHITQAIYTAARDSGRQCIDLGHSWAAHAFLHGATLTSSGSWVDKLTGLQLGIQQSFTHAPSVLLLRLDAEFQGVGDAQDRHDAESRVWSLLTQELTTAGGGGTAAPVLVVLQSAAALPSDSPIAQHLVTEPILATLPNDAYLRHLWKPLVLEAPMLSLLRGRPAKSVTKLHTMYQEAAAQHPTSAGGETTTLEVLRSCCDELDRERRRQGHVARIPRVQWCDIGGLDHVRKEIIDAIELPLHHPHLLPKGGGRTGLLLFGPPGTGKTLVAKAVATECSLPFISVKGPELMGSYIGESEENVRHVFAEARHLASQNQPRASILFFDELDSLAPRRGDHASGGNVTDRVVATLFAELDRKLDQGTVFCLGATNRPDLLDPALLRPGRLDRLVYLGVDPSDHARILATQIQKLRLTEDASTIAERVAHGLPPTLTGADLSTIASAALIRATERLCDEADRELDCRVSNGEHVTLDQVLSSWDDDRLVPVVTLEDLEIAASLVAPSVTAEELRRYEAIRDKFSFSIAENKSPDPIDE